MSISLSDHQCNVIEWANEVFPDRSAKDVLLKSHEEWGELTKKLDDPMEYADVMILLLDLAAMNNISGDTLSLAIREKMAINRARKWEVDRVTGIMRHL